MLIHYSADHHMRKLARAIRKPIVNPWWRGPGREDEPRQAELGIVVE